MAKTEKKTETPEEKIVRLEAENADLIELNVQLMKKLESLEKTGSKNQEIIVEVDNKKYRFTIPTFRHKQVVYKREEVTENKKLLKELVESQFGGLELIEEEAE